jgi:hypothetical protein
MVLTVSQAHFALSQLNVLMAFPPDLYLFSIGAAATGFECTIVTSWKIVSAAF